MGRAHRGTEAYGVAATASASDMRIGCKTGRVDVIATARVYTIGRRCHCCRERTQYVERVVRARVEVLAKSSAIYKGSANSSPGVLLMTLISQVIRWDLTFVLLVCVVPAAPAPPNFNVATPGHTPCPMT